MAGTKSAISLNFSFHSSGFSDFPEKSPKHQDIKKKTILFSKMRMSSFFCTSNVRVPGTGPVNVVPHSHSASPVVHEEQAGIGTAVAAGWSIAGWVTLFRRCWPLEGRRLKSKVPLLRWRLLVRKERFQGGGAISGRRQWQRRRRTERNFHQRLTKAAICDQTATYRTVSWLLQQILKVSFSKLCQITCGFMCVLLRL